MIKSQKQSGFSVIELLITLFIASAFLIAGYQLYSTIIKNGTDAQVQSRANSIADEYLQKNKFKATNPCTAQSILNSVKLQSDTLSNVNISVQISCPYGTNVNVSKISSTITYNDPQQTYTIASYVNKPCQTGYILVPGNKNYGTNDFCVMKYEAKNDGTGKAVSTNVNTPWTNIPQTASASFIPATSTNSSIITDGLTASSSYYDGGTGLKSVTTDLGSVNNINTIIVWHYWADSRIYNGTKTEVSVDGTNWTTVFDSAVSGTYAESSAGHIINFSPKNVRFIRDWANGSNANDGDHWVEVAGYKINGASAVSAAACTNCHLMTDAEWMTIATNVASVASNWSSGTVGTGFIYSGHNDNSPSNALTADTNDNNGYFDTGNTTGSNQRRTLTLTNGEVIWDLAGNVWEWTSGVVAGGQPGITGGGAAWREWTAITNAGSLNVNLSPRTSNITGASNWNSNNGIGQVYSNADDSTIFGIMRGGNWLNSSSIAGIFSTYFAYNPGSLAPSIGFRVVAPTY